MQKAIAMMLLIVIAIMDAGAASTMGGIPVRDDLFWSEEELSHVDFSAPLTDDERTYYENSHIYLLTAAPSEPVYVYFGHAGIIVSVPDRNEIMFDYGTFRFDKGFYLNFALGRLYYSLIASPAIYRIGSFMDEDRTVRRIELDLTPAEKKAVIGFLAYNSLPENEIYLYDYYRDNCATRPRDIYNAATGGEFRRWAERIETGKSFRAWSTPYMHPSFFFAFILNYLQGPMVDRPVMLYEACFLPDVLMKAVEEFEGMEAETLYETVTREETPGHYSLILRTIPAAAALAFAIMLTASKHKSLRIVGDISAAAFWLFIGILSSVLVFMMAATNHSVTYWNGNAIILSPAVIALAFLHLASLGKKERRQPIHSLSRAFLMIATLMLIAKGCLMGEAPQDNIAYYLTAFAGYGAETAATGLSLSRSIPQQRRRYAQDQ